MSPGSSIAPRSWKLHRSHEALAHHSNFRAQKRMLWAECKKGKEGRLDPNNERIRETSACHDACCRFERCIILAKAGVQLRGDFSHLAQGIPSSGSPEENLHCGHQSHEDRTLEFALGFKGVPAKTNLHDALAAACGRLRHAAPPCAGVPGSSRRIPLFLGTSPTAICTGFKDCPWPQEEHCTGAFA